MDKGLYTVGILLNDQCHKIVYTESTGLTYIKLFRERNLLLWRSGLSILNVNVKIYFCHEHLLLNRFASDLFLSQKNCILLNRFANSQKNCI